MIRSGRCVGSRKSVSKGNMICEGKRNAAFPKDREHIRGIHDGRNMEPWWKWGCQPYRARLHEVSLEGKRVWSVANTPVSPNPLGLVGMVVNVDTDMREVKPSRVDMRERRTRGAAGCGCCTFRGQGHCWRRVC